MISSAKDAQQLSSAKDKENVISLPHVGIALHGWMQLMTFNLICKQNIEGRTQEIKSVITTHAVRQPFTAEQLAKMNRGQRSWQREMLHALPDLQMNTDDQVTFFGTTYRVEEKISWPEYGYIQYNLVEDYGYMNEVSDNE